MEFSVFRKSMSFYIRQNYKLLVNSETFLLIVFFFREWNFSVHFNAPSDATLQQHHSLDG